jgi:ATP-dependent Clp protease ATP-binding subunit ClpB
VTDTGEVKGAAREMVMRDLRGSFRPEFLNRVDDIVLFKPLTLDETELIVDLQVKELQGRLSERDVNLELSPAARKHIAKAAYDPVYGARPLKRYLQHKLETRVGRAMISSEVAQGARISVDAVDDELKIDIAMS